MLSGLDCTLVTAVSLSLSFKERGMFSIRDNCLQNSYSRLTVTMVYDRKVLLSLEIVLKNTCVFRPEDISAVRTNSR